MTETQHRVAFIRGGKLKKSVWYTSLEELRQDYKDHPTVIFYETRGYYICCTSRGKQMKRWLLFGGQDYYPLGGVNGLIGDFSSEKKAREEGNRRKGLSNFEEDQIDWFYILDTEGTNK